MVGYEFDMGEFLAREIRDQTVGEEKLLLVYLCIITLMCIVVGVQELLGIDELVEATNTMDIGLIRDAANSLARKAKRGVDMLDKMFR